MQSLVRPAFVITLIFSVLFSSNWVLAQDPFYHKLTTENGLPSNCVYRIFQDKDGYIWFATDNGAARFDGYNFVTYSQKDGLTDTEVFFIRQDRKGRIWFFTSNGLPCFLQNGKMHNPSNTQFLQKIKPNSWVTSFAEDGSGNIWLATFNCQFIKINSNNEVSEYQWKKYQKSVNDIHIDSSGKAWIAAGEGVICLSIDPLKYIFRFKNFTKSTIKSVFTSDSKILSISQNNYFESDLNENSTKIFADSRLDNPPISFIKTRGNKIFLADLKQLKIVTTDNNDKIDVKVLLTENQVAGAFEDREKNIWINTIGHGAVLINNPEIKNYKNVFNNNVLLQAIYSKDNKKYYLGGDGGKIAIFENGKIKNLNLLDDLKKNGRARIRSIIPFYDNEIALVCEYRLITLKNDTVEKIFKYGVKSLLVQKNYFYTGNGAGFAEVPTKYISTAYAGLGKNSFGILNDDSVSAPVFAKKPLNRTLDLDLDSNGLIWVATNKGLFVYDIKKQVYSPAVAKYNLLKQPIQCVKVIGENVLCAIQGYGLGILNNNKLRILSSKDWLKNSIINKIVPSLNNEFWLCTNKGLFLLKPNADFSKIIVTHFGLEDGLLSEGVNDVMWDGKKCLIACDEGLTILPEFVVNPSNKPKPALVQAGFLVNDKVIPDGENPEFPEENLNVEFSYSCLDFRYFQSYLFRYRLFKDDNWKNKNTSLQRLGNLRSGTYTVEVQAKVPGGQWGKSLVYPTFTILPPIWKRGWFVFLSIIGSIITTGFVALKINKNQIEKVALDQQLTEANLKALRAQIKPHFIFNSLNSVQYFFLQDKKKEGLEFLSRLSHLMRKILSDSDRHFHSLSEELDLLNDYLEIERERIGSDRLNFRIIVDHRLEKTSISIPTMLLQPILENAIWHGIMNKPAKGGLVLLSVLKVNPTQESENPNDETTGRIEISIQDNGVGREITMETKKTIGTSFGMSSIEQKINLLNKRYKSHITLLTEDLKDSKNNAVGTKVTINLPIIEEKGAA